MKRIFVTLLSLLYMLSATGATVHIHYCMGKLVSAGLVDNDNNDRCGKCGMVEKSQKKGCCKDEHKTIKTNDHQQAKTICTKPFVETAGPMLPIRYSYPAPAYTDPVNDLTQANGPPPLLPTCALYIFIRNFRI